MEGGCGSQWKAAGFLFCVMVFASAERPVFTNHFLVELHKDGEEEARQVAAEHGFGVRKVRFFFHTFHMLFPEEGQPCAISLQICKFSVFLCYAAILPSVLKHDIASGDLSWVM
jgi:proprotein convertase subtilisin/kexin type 2